MSQLFGTFENISVDNKGRLSIPSHLRKVLPEAANNTFVIVRGTEGCLFAYPKNEWVNFWNKLEKLPVTKENSLFKRRIIGSLKESSVDGQGRITISNKLRELSYIKNDVTVVGVGEKLQIWNSTTWKDLLNEAEDVSYDDAYYKAMDQIDAKE